jgi:dsDNA-specific endonuclease/ATPase MutS2
MKEGIGKKKTQISKMRNRKGDITRNTKEIQRIIRNYLESLYSNKLENLEEMNKFLDTYDQTKLNQEDTNHLNISIAQNEIEAAIKHLPKTKVQDLMDSLLNYIRPLKKN